VAVQRTSAHAGMRAARSARGCAREAACAALGAAASPVVFVGAKRRHAWPQARRAAHAPAAASRCACRSPVRLAGRGALVCVGCGAHAVRSAPSLAEPPAAPTVRAFPLRCAPPGRQHGAHLGHVCGQPGSAVAAAPAGGGHASAIQAGARARRACPCAFKCCARAPRRTRTHAPQAPPPLGASADGACPFGRARGGRACTSRRARTRPRLHACWSRTEETCVR
jgi:hypothetical protein